MATTKAAIRSVDFTLQNHGSILLLGAHTPAAQAWMKEHLPIDDPETQFWCGSIVIEPRYIEPILRGIASDGLGVE